MTIASGAWIELCGDGWLLLEAELIDGSVTTWTADAVAYSGPEPGRAVTALVRREQTLTEVAVDWCGCDGRIALLLAPTTAKRLAEIGDQAAQRLTVLGQDRP